MSVVGNILNSDKFLWIQLIYQMKVWISIGNESPISKGKLPGGKKQRTY